MLTVCKSLIGSNATAAGVESASVIECEWSGENDDVLFECVCALCECECECDLCECVLCGCVRE